MHLRNFDLNLIVVLDALLNERNVTRAADMLCVTQPAVSNALQRIRLYFGDQILVRQGREMKLTPYATTLVGPVRELMLSAGQLLNADYQFDPSRSTRSFRIAMSDYCIAILVNPLMRILSTEAPDIQCDMTTITDKSAASLQSGEIDMCITAQTLPMQMPDLNADPEPFERTTLFRDRFICAVSADNPAVRDMLDRETYLRLPHGMARLGSRGFLLEELSLKDLDLRAKVSVVISSLACLPMIVEGTPLVISLPRRLARHVAGWERLRFFEAPIEIVELEETLYWHRRYEHDKAHRWLREAFVRAAAGLGVATTNTPAPGSPINP
jgi:LysR family transcriptional regulator, nod-box dependent transcriptional activator